MVFDSFVDLGEKILSQQLTATYSHLAPTHIWSGMRNWVHASRFKYLLSVLPAEVIREGVAGRRQLNHLTKCSLVCRMNVAINAAQPPLPQNKGAPLNL